VCIIRSKKSVKELRRLNDIVAGERIQSRGIPSADDAGSRSFRAGSGISMGHRLRLPLH
jgi:hypothetical protein